LERIMPNEHAYVKMATVTVLVEATGQEGNGV
jgi:hypothetical protein